MVSRHMDPNLLRKFYMQGFTEQPIHRKWSRMWNKHYRIRLVDRKFVKLNKFRSRLSFRSLKKFCIHFAPKHVYMSVLNWMMPERVGSKIQGNWAYPFGGEFVADIDISSLWRTWGGVEGFNPSGIELAYDKILVLIEKIQENYDEIHVVFSGKRGFHVHVWDFDIRDWTHYDERNPIKSHEVARFLYTRHLKAALGEMGRYHFLLSSDPMRMMTVPFTLNGETGKICFYVGGPREFEKLTFQEILRRSDASQYVYDNGFRPLHSHLEPLLRIRR
jgi:hypothetical protein